VTSYPPPPWLEELARSVTHCMHAVDAMAPVGCHYHREDETWEVTIFASMTEVVGGQQDGLRFPCCFVLDVGGLIALFADVESVRWQSLRQEADDEVGAHLAIEGTYQGARLLLRIPAEAPSRFEAGRKANVYEMRIVNVW
jgi:hypothetical protein